MRHITYKVIQLIVVIFLLFFLFFNIVSSQIISPLYFQLINNDQKAVVTFLQKIKNLPDFQKYLEMNKNIYGSTIENSVFIRDKERREEISKLQTLLEKNPSSRDILYDLSILYKEDGNEIKAKEYMDKAKKIDPLINN